MIATTRPPADRHGRVAHRRGERDLAHAEPAPAGEQLVALAEIEPGGPDFLPGDDVAFARGSSSASTTLGVLLDQHRVGAGRHRRAGEDADSLAGADLAGKAMAGRGHADDPELRVAWQSAARTA